LAELAQKKKKKFSVPYRDRRPLSGPLYRLVASARSRGYHSGRFSVSAGPSILRGSWRPRRGAPATGAAGETRVCADGWALWVTGRCATPIKTLGSFIDDERSKVRKET
jgi:hypothetical protein